jgi:hypothetical protein
LATQLDNYKNKNYIMKNEEIYNKWYEFINNPKYIKYFESNENKWINMLIDLTNFIDNNNKIPSYKNDKILYKWLSHQKLNYKNKTDIMLNEDIYNKWTEIINNPQYKKYFDSYEDKWIQTLNQVKIYIDENNKRPSQVDKNNKINKLGKWLSPQNKNYKNKIDIMKNENIRKLWEEFSNKYKDYFK